MRKFVLVGVVLAAGALAVTCTQEGANTPEAGLSQEDADLLEQATERAERLKELYITLRGNGLSLGLRVSPDPKRPEVGFESADTTQTFVPDPEGLLLHPDGRVGLRVSVDGGPWADFSLDTDPVDEGKLFRIHVDRPEKLHPDSKYKAVVLGFYAKEWSEDAVERQRTKCIPCGELLVCGSDPHCP